MSKINGQKWLITGGCGFIGTSIIKKILPLGIKKIRVIDNLSVGTATDLSRVTQFDTIEPHQLSEMSESSKPVELIVGDILDERLAKELATGVDVIVHLAANTGVAPSVENPRADCMSNVLGTFNYLEAARHAGCKHFVFASSGAIVGECLPPLHEELPAHPVSPYGASKLSGEAYCSAYYRTFGINTAALRFSNVYGPLSSHKNSLVARCIRRVMNDEPIEIFGEGKNTRDFLYIDDLVNAVILAAQSNAGGEVYQIATSEETTVNELVQKLVPILRQKGFSNIPVIYKEARLGDVMRNYADTSKAQKVLGWNAKVPLTEGLQITVDWFLER